MDELTGAKNVSIIVLDGHPQRPFYVTGMVLDPWSNWNLEMLIFFLLLNVQDKTGKTWLLEIFSTAGAEKTTSRFSRERKLNPNNHVKRIQPRGNTSSRFSAKFSTFLIAIFSKSFLLKFRKEFASKFLQARSILDIIACCWFARATVQLYPGGFSD